MEKVNVGVLFLETVQGRQRFQISVEGIKVAAAVREMSQGGFLLVFRYDLDQFATFASEVVCQQAFDLDPRGKGEWCNLRLIFLVLDGR